MKFLSIIILILNIVGIFSLSCKECDKSKYPPNMEDQCPWGVGPPYACTCCDACLKGPGESCGGNWHMQGFCAKGLECEPLPGTTYFDPVFKPKGKCVSP
ncbi:UNVERIFIED_CONTAM: hypothetical protein RMT77_018279 [Armadillidium vulgare]